MFLQLQQDVYSRFIIWLDFICDSSGIIGFSGKKLAESDGLAGVSKRFMQELGSIGFLKWL